MKSSFSGLWKTVRQTVSRCYPLPAALAGYACGILIAVQPGILPDPAGTYTALSLRDALSAALSSELPFWLAALFLALLRPARTAGGLLIAVKAACCGFAAERILIASPPSFSYFQYVVCSVLLLSLYACLIRQAVYFTRGSQTIPQAGEFLVQSLFYIGSALLLMPLRYITGF